ncbi:GIY-YIG nuclease family protein [Mesomycoplasma neurolyticum]|uniref:Excinuclease ABC subunit C n=1 Tax=Mesomycoplasma neurolyticum TaxID=2120 RepID=A0A449A5L6_9BACT|nr:GIY-YIG nuclease family protein [Mesomycoplasma neurolyticum]VEU59545.1 Excinuclease ABC subunit C [Mesomycoplasma neurolyticum]
MTLTLEEKIKKNVPEKPGVYFWKQNNKIIYIGKSVNLKKRMLQYFKGSVNSFFTPKMVEEIDDFEFIITKNEKSALILEANKIEHFFPKYNILLKNNGKYPYLAVIKGKTIKFEVKYKYEKNKNIFYFGPFPPKFGLGNIKKILEKEFLYEIGFLIPKNEWTLPKVEETFLKIKKIFLNKNTSFLAYLDNIYQKAKMDDTKLEIALEIKKSIDSLKKNFEESQFIKLNSNKHSDFITFIENDKNIIVVIYFYRWGFLFNSTEEIFEKNIAFENFVFEFLQIFYQKNVIPDQIIMNSKFKDLNLDNIYFKEKILFPQKGDIANTLNNLENQSLEKNEQILNLEIKNEIILNEFKNLLNLKKLDHFLIVDNSFTNKDSAIGFVMFYNKLKNISNKNFFYFHPKNEKNSDLFLMKKTIQKYFEKNNKNFLIDLIIVDGGKLQINAVKQILKKMKINDVKVAGLVKNEKHTTNYLINDVFDRLNVSKDLFLFLSKIQHKVDYIAKKGFNKLKTKQFTKS